MFNFRSLGISLFLIALILFVVGCNRSGELSGLGGQSVGNDDDRQSTEENTDIKIDDGLCDDDGVITNSIGMKLKLIKAGKFMMGSKESGNQERPVHEVEITKPFYIGVYEVTQEQYYEIMGRMSSHFKGPNRPVMLVSWKEARLFCAKLAEKERVVYRLPTEAEWEYACRAGKRTEYYWGNEMDGRYAWYFANSERRTHDVGTRKPNQWGLYDMSGNVYEWCYDWYENGYYSTSPSKNPRGPAQGQRRVVRGGGWADSPSFCRSAFRRSRKPTRRYGDCGFRVIRPAE